MRSREQKSIGLSNLVGSSNVHRDDYRLQIWIIDIFIMTTYNIDGYDMQNVDETIVMNLDTTWS